MAEQYSKLMNNNVSLALKTNRGKIINMIAPSLSLSLSLTRNDSLLKLVRMDRIVVFFQINFLCKLL